jgi:hypothetical protein
MDLDARRLNRALLARQGLLRRRHVAPLSVIERLVGLQAQEPRDPYVALWTRLEGYRPARLALAMEERRVVRMTLLRGTLHMVTARDAIALRPLLQPVIERTLLGQRAFKRAFDGIDLEMLTSWYRELLEERPRTRAELVRATAERWPKRDASSLGYAMYLIPTVQVTPRGVWGRSGRATFTTLRAWVGTDAAPDTDPTEMILRYLTAFGPATPADISAWSGLRGTREVVDGLRPRLRIVRDDRGRELVDVPRGPLPDPATPAPVRFLPEYDNVVLGHKDRARIVGEGTRAWEEVGWGFVLVDGFTAGRWRLTKDEERATLRVERFRPFSRAERSEVTDEARSLAAFLAEDAPARVTIA